MNKPLKKKRRVLEQKRWHFGLASGPLWGRYSGWYDSVFLEGNWECWRLRGYTAAKVGVNNTKSQMQLSEPARTRIDSHPVTRYMNKCLLLNWELESPRGTHTFTCKALWFSFALEEQQEFKGYLSASLLGGTAACASWRRNQFLGHTQVLLITHYEELVTWAQRSQNAMRRRWSREDEGRAGRCQLLSGVSKDHVGCLRKNP